MSSFTYDSLQTPPNYTSTSYGVLPAEYGVSGGYLCNYSNTYVEMTISSEVVTWQCPVDYIPIVIGKPGGCQLPMMTISSPVNQADFQLAQSNYIKTADIVFAATSSDSSDSISWSLQLTYSTADGKGVVDLTDSFETSVEQAHKIAYSSTGGQLTVNAAQGSASAGVKLTITGASIPDAAITAQLVSLYATGATPSLLEVVPVFQTRV